MERIEIAPEELYFLGKYMKAKYIDYDYISAMEDIGQRYDWCESEIKERLMRKNYLMEDFSGEIEIDTAVEKLLHPVFFGEFESELRMEEANKQDPDAVSCHKFHFENNQVTHIEMKAGRFCIERDGLKSLEKLWKEIMPEDYDAENNRLSAKYLEEKEITRILTLKNMAVGFESVVFQFAEAEKRWYLGGEEEEVISVSKEEWAKYWKQIMEGGKKYGIL